MSVRLRRGCVRFLQFYITLKSAQEDLIKNAPKIGRDYLFVFREIIEKFGMRKAYVSET